MAPHQATAPAEPEPDALAARRAAEKEDRQRGMNPLQVLLDDARHHQDGTVKVTQAKLAELTGLTRGQVQYILRGASRTAPQLEDLQKLAKALDLEMAQVQRAAGQVYGWSLYATKDERVEVLAAKAGRLKDRDLVAVMALVDTMLSIDP